MPSLYPGRLRGALTALVLSVTGGLLVALPHPGAAQAAPIPQPAHLLDGPSADLTGLGGMSVARDGTGGLVYLKQVGGVSHVFVSPLTDGRFQAPVEVDAASSSDSSQPVIAASSGGMLIVAFINNRSLDVVQRLTAAQPLSAPIPLFAGAANPSIGLTYFGKAYIAFTADGSGGHDVRTAYSNLGQWALESAPLDANPADDAGSGSGRPQIAVSGDGIAIVVWGENGHIYTRRVWGTSPSVVFEEADPASLGGWNEVSASNPAIGTGGDSSYASVVFQEQFAGGGGTQTRVLARRLQASQYNRVVGVDGLSTPGTVNASQPNVSVGEYGRGFTTASRDDSNALIATHMSDGEWLQNPFQVDSLTNQSPSDAVPATAGIISTLIAWQQDSGLGQTEIRARYAADGVTLGPELVLSAPADGPTDAAEGLAAGGDIAGNAAVAWVQGAPGAQEVVTEQMFQPPGTATPAGPTGYVRVRRPRLTWWRAGEQWGPMRYTVSVDGVSVGQTVGTTSLVTPPLADGPHHWHIFAQNLAGLSTTSRSGSFWLDAVPPAVTLQLLGRWRVKTLLHLTVTATDAPPPELPSAASGIASIKINWGDGTKYTGVRRSSHRYLKPGRYTLTVTVADRAGNVTTVTRRIIIKLPPKPKPKPKAKAKKPAAPKTKAKTTDRRTARAAAGPAAPRTGGVPIR